MLDIWKNNNLCASPRANGLPNHGVLTLFTVSGIKFSSWIWPNIQTESG